eukprot:scaffold12630_cov118-Isochrysis_galbana.AAC.4
MAFDCVKAALSLRRTPQHIGFKRPGHAPRRYACARTRQAARTPTRGALLPNQSKLRCTQPGRDELRGPDPRAARVPECVRGRLVWPVSERGAGGRRIAPALQRGGGGSAALRHAHGSISDAPHARAGLPGKAAGRARSRACAHETPVNQPRIPKDQIAATGHGQLSLAQERISRRELAPVVRVLLHRVGVGVRHQLQAPGQGRLAYQRHHALHALEAGLVKRVLVDVQPLDDRCPRGVDPPGPPRDGCVERDEEVVGAPDGGEGANDGRMRTDPPCGCALARTVRRKEAKRLMTWPRLAAPRAGIVSPQPATQTL